MDGTCLMPAERNHLPELLAPAGNVESFFAALENGADAVYLGLRQFSARATAANFTLKELSHLLPFAQQRQLSVYVALNSLVTTPELPALLDVLQALSDLRVDGVIAQDPGIFFVAQHQFPKLKIHASTLAAVHNSAGVHQMERLGAQRVVLARELSLEEITEITHKTRMELEIFVHGALCFSYSGLCLASSFRGGHSGLQGRCVQPCRLHFHQGRKDGFFLSCNDFCAISQLPKLKKLRLSAFKIEGRMKPADYVALVVQAYRRVLDASPDDERDVIAEVHELLLRAPARRLTSGFLSDDPAREILTPHRSGSSGLWVGTIKNAETGSIAVALRHSVSSGDRLRVESTEGKEKGAFTISEIWSPKGETLAATNPKTQVRLAARGEFLPGERLFRVASKGENPWREPAALWRQVHAEVPEGRRFAPRFSQQAQLTAAWPAPPLAAQHANETLIVKIGRAQDLLQVFQSPAEWVMLTATKANLERLAKQKLIPAQKQRFIWSLPPILAEKDLDYYRPAVLWYLERGFRHWEVNNWGHLDLFAERDKLGLIAGARFNIRNPTALASVAEAGCNWAVLSLEITRQELAEIPRGLLAALPIVTVYTWPALFMSRLPVKLLEDRPFSTDRKDVYFVHTEKQVTSVFADRPMSWLAQMATLRGYGYRCFLLDVSAGPRHHPMKELERLLSGYKHGRADEPYSLFNFDREPVKQRNK
jgi:U32 family peptidase